MNEVVKENINRLDRELKERFDMVSITETNKITGFYFTIDAKKTIDNKTYQLVVEVNKNNFRTNVAHWSYLTNPNNEKDTMERSSSLDNLANDMEDIITKKRFKKEYLESICENIVSINESNNDTETPKSIVSNINNILVYHDVAYFSDIKKEISYNENVDIFIKTPYKLKFELKEQLRESTKIQLERDILKIEHIDYIIFKTDNTVEISVSE
jgi:hypothetical protein